jgi:hypothetical protein
MATIHTPVEGFTGIVAGVNFAQGEGQTDKPNALAYFRRHDYTIEGDEPAPVVIPEGDPSDDWKVDQLKAYAKEHEVDLDGATKKDDILAAISAAASSDPVA